MHLNALPFALVALLLSTLPIAAQPTGGISDGDGSDTASIDRTMINRTMIDAASTEEGFIRYEVTGIFSRDIPVRFAGDTLFLPYSAFASSLGILNSTSSNLDTLAGEMPLKQPYTLIRSAGTIQRRGATDTIPPRSVCVVDGDVYVEARLLARCMGVQIIIDLAELKFSVIPDSRIPVVQRKRNEGIYAGLAYREVEGAPRRSPVQRQILGSAALNYSLMNTLQEGRSATSGSFQLAGPFMFGLLNVMGSGRYNRDDLHPFTGDINSIGWQIQFPHFSPLTQINAGLMRSTTATSLSLAINNLPLGYRAQFGVHSLDGHTQPGWDVELYDGQTIVEVTRGDSNGYYHFQLPIGYGATYRAVHQVGPHGERIIEYRTFQLNPALIPPGSVQYSTSFFSEKLKLDGRVEGRANVSVGVLNWLTLGAGSSGRSNTLRTAHIDSLDLSLHANLWLGDATPLGLYYTPRSRMAGGSISYNVSDNLAVQAGIDSFDVRRPTEFIAGSSFSVGLGSVSFGGYGQYVRDELATSISGSPRLSFYLGGIGISTSTALTWLNPHTELEQGAAHLAASSTLQVTVVPWSRIFILANVTYDYDIKALTDLSVSSSIRILSSLSLGLSYALRRTDRLESTVSAQITWDIADIVRLGTGVSYQNEGYSMISTLEGGVMISPGGIVTNTYGSVNQSMIIVRAFVDRNLNGTRESDEETRSEPGADLSIGSSQVHTDEGEFSSLSPYQEGVVVIAFERYAAEGLYPRRSRYPVYTLPGATTIIDVPLAPGTMLSGRCRVINSMEEGRRLSPAILIGLSIRMVSTEGAAEYEGEVFEDGTLIVEGVSEGSYRLQLDEEQLATRAIRLSDVSTIFTVTPDATTLPEITFVRLKAGESGAGSGN